MGVRDPSQDASTITTFPQHFTQAMNRLTSNDSHATNAPIKVDRQSWEYVIKSGIAGGIAGSAVRLR